MYKILTLVLLIATLSAGAQTTEGQVSQNPASVLKFKELEHDFTQIPQGKPVFHFFEIQNTGKDALKLDNVQASCGCTTPEWSHDPIPAGGTAQIKVGYNAAAEGHFEKFITVTYNGNQTQQIKITGTVWKAPAGSAPANASIQFLKQQNF
ncbi:MAG: DUF1573 domain-containing protein [Chitinophagaceae bacterium]